MLLFEKATSMNKTMIMTYKQESPTPSMRYGLILQSFLTTVILFTSFLFITFKRSLRKRTANQLFANLLIVHTTFQLSTIIASLINNNRLQVILYCAFLIAMFLALTVMSVERLIAIKYPYTSNSMEIRHKVTIFLFTWLPTILFLIFYSAALHVHKMALNIITTGFIGFAVLTLLPLNIAVMIISIRHDYPQNDDVNIVLFSSTSQRHGGEIPRRKTLRDSFFCCFAVLAFVCFWLPYFIYDLMLVLQLYEGYNRTSESLVEHVGLLVSLAHMLLFVCFNKDMVKEVKKRFHAKLSRTIVRVNYDANRCVSNQVTQQDA